MQLILSGGTAAASRGVDVIFRASLRNRISTVLISVETKPREDVRDLDCSTFICERLPTLGQIHVKLAFAVVSWNGWCQKVLLLQPARCCEQLFVLPLLFLNSRHFFVTSF